MFDCEECGGHYVSADRWFDTDMCFKCYLDRYGIPQQIEDWLIDQGWEPPN